MTTTIYYRTGEVGEPDAYERVGTVTVGPHESLQVEGDERCKRMIEMLRSTSVGTQMSAQDFVRTLPDRINPYMGYAVVAPENEAAKRND